MQGLQQSERQGPPCAQHLTSFHCESVQAYTKQDGLRPLGIWCTHTTASPAASAPWAATLTAVGLLRGVLQDQFTPQLACRGERVHKLPSVLACWVSSSSCRLELPSLCFFHAKAYSRNQVQSPSFRMSFVINGDLEPLHLLFSVIPCK